MHLPTLLRSLFLLAALSQATVVVGQPVNTATRSPIGNTPPAGGTLHRPKAKGQDPFLWLEDIEGKRALEWVRAKNAATEAALGKTRLYTAVRERMLSILNSNDRIELPIIVGDEVYNLLQDATHSRGIVRRSGWREFISGQPHWETVLDIDSLAKAESVSWSFRGATCLEPEERFCMISLSRGGADAVELREFDLVTRQFVGDGFWLPEAKSRVAWLDDNTLLVGTNFGAGSLTTSGYPRMVRRWARGTPLTAATAVLEVAANHVGVSLSSYHDGSRMHARIVDATKSDARTTYLYANDKLRRLLTPDDADVYVVQNQLVVYLREAWSTGGETWNTGSLIAMPLDGFLTGQRNFQLIMKPGSRETITGISPSRDALIVSVMNNVQSELRRYQVAGNSWSFQNVPAPRYGSILVGATSMKSNRFFFVSSNFLQPTTLYLSDNDGTVEEVRQLRATFNAKGLTVEQMHATSKDGTRVPFFIVYRQGLARDGSHPTLLSAYGGFEVSNIPAYSSSIGAAWLERGGVYVVANTRGGGEFGPEWHRAGVRENRQRVFDDFIAVSEELIKQRITSPAHLGIMGASNGGLLVGVAVTQRPELFGAAVLQVPLLDMQRYPQLLAGASWLSEYGDPEKPEEWAYLSRYSPYHNLKAGTKYPPVFLATITRDDRVHPAHARKMAAKMESLGIPFYFYENSEGGHGGAVTTEQRAKAVALTYSYLWKRLGNRTER